MPYKSKAQAAKFHELLKEGKISKKTVDEFDKASKGKKLPERLTPKKKTEMPLSNLDKVRKYRKDKYGI